MKLRVWHWLVWRVCSLHARTGSNPGWYLGSAQATTLKTIHPLPTLCRQLLLVGYSGDAIYLATAGYKWRLGYPRRTRARYDGHDRTKASSGGVRSHQTHTVRRPHRRVRPCSTSFMTGIWAIAGAYHSAAGSASVSEPL